MNVPSLLVCKEKTGDHVHPEVFTHEGCAVALEGLSSQEEECHIIDVQGMAKELCWVERVWIAHRHLWDT